MTFFKRSAVLAALWVISFSAAAFDIVLTVSDQAGEGFNDVSPPFAEQIGNTGTTLGEQRLNVFQAAADYWEARLALTVDVVVDIRFDPLSCNSRSGVLGSAGAQSIFRDFDNAPRANTYYVSAVANNLAGRRLGTTASDISATFNSSIDNNNECLNGTNWWLGIDSPAPNGTIGLFDTVLHEIAHGLGVSSGIRDDGELLAGAIDAYSYYLYDEETEKYWREMTVSERVESAVNTGNVTFRGPNVEANSGHLTSGKTNGHVRVYAPNPYRFGSSISHWDTALVPDELMEPSATPTSDDRSTVQMLKDLGWVLRDGPAIGAAGVVGFISSGISANESQGTVSVDLQRTLGVEGAVTVEFSTAGGDAKPGTDYTAISGAIVSWADGESGSKSVVVSLIDDADLEENETINLVIANATGGASLGNSLSTINVVSDDVSPSPEPGSIGFVTTTQTVNENELVAVIELQRTNGTDGQVSVTLKSGDISATANSDYIPIRNQTLSWADGESGIRRINLGLLDDSDIEVDELVRLTISDPVGGVLLDETESVVTIVSDDIAPGDISFLQASISVQEGQAQIHIQLSRTGGSDGAVSARLRSFDVSAVASEDYEGPINTVLTWLDGEAGIRSVPFNVFSDELDESDEVVDFTISDVTGGASTMLSSMSLTISEARISQQGDGFLLDTIVPIIAARAAQKAKQKKLDSEKNKANSGTN